MMLDTLNILKSLFKGRQDVFAIRWEKDSKQGYVPAYDLNWDEFKIHKENGGTLKNFANKKYSPLTDARLINHLAGKEVIGIYPLLPDNTSWFIVADFDETSSKSKSWLDECRLFTKECEKYRLPVYVERSRSGKGGHVWLFFESPYPAIRSRTIFNYLLTTSGISSSKSSSFDRLFPNQDSHSGKELGNLIALPFQKKAMQNRNTCFVDIVTENALENQWETLNSAKKVSTAQLDELYFKVVKSGESKLAPVTVTKNEQYGKLHIILDNHIVLSRNHLPNLLLRYLRDNINFTNNEYWRKKNTGKNTFNTQSRFTNLDEQADSIIIPRGFANNLIRHCKEHHIDYFFEDKRKKLDIIEFQFFTPLYAYQQAAVDVASKKDFGVIVSPPGSGKTLMGLAIIAQKKQPALIIVHRKQLFDQWIERIQSFLGIPSFQIGKIEGGKCDIGKNITVAMIQSLQTDKISFKLYESFGTILVDECHHMPAKMFRQVIGNFHSYYLYGFTATPIRKNKDERLIFIHIGEIIHEAIIPIDQKLNKGLSVVVQNTNLFVPFNSATDKVETLLHVLIHDTARNELIVNDVKREVKAGRKVLVLTERKAHIDILYQYLKTICEVIILTGEDNKENRKNKISQVENNDYQLLLSTGQFLGEGIDIGTLSCLVLAYPFSFEGKLVQYIGRVQRSPIVPIIYDYKDFRIEYLLNLFKDRNKYYRRLLKNDHLTKFDELILVFKGTEFYINETDQLLTIECLDLPLPIAEFKDDIAWQVRVTSYDQGEGVLSAEILNYDFPLSQSKDTLQGSFYFYGIEKIKFRNIDTGGLLKSVILSNDFIDRGESHSKIMKQPAPIAEQVLLKTMKVPFWKISFMAGAVSFSIYIEAINQEVAFEIVNTDIRPEFAAIQDYFQKALKKKFISVDIAIRYNIEKIISATAKSQDIDVINNTMIDNVRFQFVKKEILKSPTITNKQMHTSDELLVNYKESKKIYSTDQELIDDILNIKKSKHYLHLKFLSAKHEASVLKVRFVLQPFSFLFLLSGERNYYIVWETLDTEEATYIWNSIKSTEALRNLVAQIEKDLFEIQQLGRQAFLIKEKNNFSRIVHDYDNLKKGFVAWKGMLEQRLL